MKKIIPLVITIISLFCGCSNAQNKPLADNIEDKQMKKVIIIGASGSLAKYVIDTLQNVPDVHLTLLARNRNRIANDTTNSTVVEADVMDYPKLKNAIAGQDIVYVNLAGDLEAMAKNIVKAMQETGVKRVIAISSIGIYETPLKPVLVPYRKLADIIESSGLDYTILRPDWFTNANEVDYAITQKGQPETGQAISRKSIAAFVATIVQNPELHKNENLGISKPD
ncbi:NAD(P)H-binding protein [Chryseobacterium koreense]